MGVAESNPQAILVDVVPKPSGAFVGIPDTSATGREPAFVEWTTYPSGAANPDFLEQVSAVAQPGTPLVFLCRSGVRSIALAEAATAAGLGPAYNILEGFEGNPDASGHRGWQGWKAAGLAWRQ